MLQSRANRALRGASAATVATFAALFWHVASGGDAPVVVGVVATWFLSVFVCVLLAGRRLSLPRLSLAVGISQFVFHALFSFAASPESAASMSPGHLHDMTAAPLGGANSSHVMAMADPTMLLGHVLAAVVTVAAVHRGERVVGAIAAFTWFVVCRVTIRPSAIVSPLSVAIRSRWAEKRRGLPLSFHPETAPSRGPPALA